MRHIDTRTIRRHRTPLLLVIAILAAMTLSPGSDRAGSATLLVAGFHAGNGGAPFAGDRRNFITISPNGDGFRDAARMSFELTRAAQVTLTALVDGGRAAPPKVVSSASRTFAAGRHHLSWTPPPDLEPRTYMLRVTVDGITAASLVVRLLGVEAGFTKQSYNQGDRAALVVSSDAKSLTLHLFQAGPEMGPSIYHGYGNDALYGVPVGKAMHFDWSGKRSRRVTLHVRVPNRASGLYFARIDTDDGRFGFAPFVLLPHPFGGHRIAVVFPTNTWGPTTTAMSTGTARETPGTPSTRSRASISPARTSTTASRPGSAATRSGSCAGCTAAGRTSTSSPTASSTSSPRAGFTGYTT